MTNRIELRVERRFAFAQGQEFGAAGAYERLSGKALFAVDPGAPAQAGITDLDKAPRDPDGLVRFSADFSLLAPVARARGNGRVFFDYGNRGNIRCLQFFNDAPASNDPRAAAHAGNGFLMRRGYAVAWLGWQADLLPGDDRFLLDVPVAMEGGHPVAGQVRVEYIADRPGPVETPSGERLGTHQGLAFYTLGQRGGLEIGGRAGHAEAPWYVARKDLARNALIVVQGHDHPLLLAHGVTTGVAHWLVPTPRSPFEAAVKLRYRQADQPCRVSPRADGRLHIECRDPQRAVTPGQFAVLYDGSRCLGGAVIESADPPRESETL